MSHRSAAAGWTDSSTTGARPATASAHKPASPAPHTDAELSLIVDMLLERGALTVAVGHGRDPDAQAAATAFAAAWQDRERPVLAVVNWPAQAASWLRQARQLVAVHPDAWLIADSASGFARIAPRLAQQQDWDPARTVGFAGLAGPGLITTLGSTRLRGLSGATATGERWRVGAAGLIIGGPG
ncbi:MAG: hypothetical protein JWO63_44 [Frankiales bacterium]|nr:hypothetical protein [Frankiales bacterium]